MLASLSFFICLRILWLVDHGLPLRISSRGEVAYRLIFNSLLILVISIVIRRTVIVGLIPIHPTARVLLSTLLEFSTACLLLKASLIVVLSATAVLLLIKLLVAASLRRKLLRLGRLEKYVLSVRLAKHLQQVF